MNPTLNLKNSRWASKDAVFDTRQNLPRLNYGTYHDIYRQIVSTFAFHLSPELQTVMVVMWP
jgi:hypothetical protein